MQPSAEPAPAVVRFSGEVASSEVTDSQSPRPPLVAALQVTLLVGLAYYAGLVAGLALRVPPATTSLMWPPNAILTAALLLVRPRMWWAPLSGALFAHVLVQHAVGWPLTLIGALFVTNCSEALIAAAGLRAFSDDATRFDTLRRVVVFVTVVGLGAPILSSFADASVVHALVGEPFWATWRTRDVCQRPHRAQRRPPDRAGVAGISLLAPRARTQTAHRVPRRHDEHASGRPADVRSTG